MLYQTILLNFLKRLKSVFTNKFTYLGLAVLLAGLFINNYSQYYIYKCFCNGTIKLPVISDLVLDHIPYVPSVTIFYDWIMLFSLLFFIIYVIIKKKENELPYYLLLFGLFFCLRGIFIVLTPFGNPDNLYAKGMFAKYNYGVFPSGHTGSAVLYFIFSEGFFKVIQSFCVFGIIFTLFLARGHYSIDILSSIIFCFSLNILGERYIKNWMIKK